MQNAIIEYFEKDRSFKNGVDLYNKLPNRMLSLCRSFSRMTGTAREMEILHYELWKHTGKPPRLLSFTLNKTLKNIIDSDDSETSTINGGDSGNSSNSIGANGAMDATTNTNSENDNSDSTGNDIRTSDSDVSNNNTKGDQTEKGTNPEQLKKEVEKATELEKASIKIRDQFPFLNQADCPDEFKILVADLITAFRDFKAARVELFKDTSDKDWYAAAEAVQTKYELRKDIFAELEHYQKTGKVLGQHPLFVKKSAKEKLRNLGTVKLSKRVTTLEGNLRRNKRKLENQKGKQAENTKQRIDEQQWELDFVKELLKNR